MALQTTVTRQDFTRIVVGVLGFALILGSLVSPWWTRGLTILDGDCTFDGGFEGQCRGTPPEDRAPATEGSYANYSPFRTPGEILGMSSDASRSTAVSVLGIGLLVSCAFAVLSLASRLGMRLGWIGQDHDVPVRFAIAAFAAGLFTVLWGALFLPLLGVNPGMLWGQEYGAPAAGDRSVFFESTRYANSGLFLGIFGLVGYPAYLWWDATSQRNAALLAFAREAARTDPPIDPAVTVAGNRGGLRA